MKETNVSIGGVGSFSKSFDELEFTDDFMFCATLSTNKELCRELAEMIIGRKIEGIVEVQDQKAIRITPDGRGVRFDVKLEGEEEICDIEMQNELDMRVLPKRSRYYQSAMDIDFLLKGEDYTRLKKSYIIFLTMERWFEGKELHKFTFRNVCIQDTEIELGDETEKIFLTTKGTADDISPELEALMNYIADKKVESDFTKRLEDAIAKIKAGEGWRIEYFQLKEKMDASFQAGEKKGKREGRAEGKAEGDREGSIRTLIEEGEFFGAPVDQTKSRMMQKFDLSADKADEYIKKYSSSKETATS